jgi:hypothetical protein
VGSVVVYGFTVVSVTVTSIIGSVVAVVSVSVSVTVGSAVGSAGIMVTLLVSDSVTVSFTDPDESTESVAPSADTPENIRPQIRTRKKNTLQTPRTPCMSIIYQSDIKIIWLVQHMKGVVFNK